MHIQWCLFAFHFRSRRTVEELKTEVYNFSTQCFPIAYSPVHTLKLSPVQQSHISGPSLILQTFEHPSHLALQLHCNFVSSKVPVALILNLVYSSSSNVHPLNLLPHPRPSSPSLYATKTTAPPTRKLRFLHTTDAVFSRRRYFAHDKRQEYRAHLWRPLVRLRPSSSQSLP